MALTTQDKIECREIAREIVREVLKEHVASCPHHQEYLISKARIIGIVVGVMFVSSIGSSTAATVATLILKALG